MRIATLVILNLISLITFCQTDTIPKVPVYDSTMFDDSHIDRLCNIERKRALLDIQQNKIYFIESAPDTPKYYKYMPSACKQYHFTYFFVPEIRLGFSGFNPMRCYMQKMDSAIKARYGDWIKESITLLAERKCASNDTPAEHYKTDKFDVAIFSATQMASEILHRRVQKFTLTHTEVNDIEVLLNKNNEELKKLCRNFDRVIPLLAQYRKQYFGYIDSNGHKIIYVNAFVANAYEENEFDYWLQTEVAVSDGGEYFWHAEYDITTHKFLYFYTNGYA